MKFVNLLIVLLAISMAYSQQGFDVYEKDEFKKVPKELLTIAVEGNSHLDGDLRFGGGLDIAFNLPGNFVLDINAGGGNLLAKIDDRYYYSDETFSEDSAYYRDNITDGEFSVSLGYEYKPASIFNPFVTCGIGFYFATFRVDEPKNEIVSTSDTVYTRYFYTESNNSSDLSTFMPLTLGVNSRFADWLQGTFYIRYNLYLDDLYLYGKLRDNPDEPTLENAQIDLNDWRGSLSIGLRLGIPIKAEL